MKKIERCRVCGNKNLVLILDLGIQKLTGVFPTSHIEGKKLTQGPLRLVKCHGTSDCCGLLQLEHSYDSKEMYGNNYGYRSGLNGSMVLHLKNKVNKIKNFVALKENDLIIDIGSNDGTTLNFYPTNFNLVGVDPTANKFKKFYKDHIKIIPDFFSAKVLKQNDYKQKAKVITSFSMFYDLDDPINFAQQISQVIDKNKGIWMFEQSYMPTMLKQISFDTICHEHLEYYGLKQIEWITKKAKLKIIDVELNDVNGGSFSVIACHESSNTYKPSPIVSKMLLEENNLNSLDKFRCFAEETKKAKDKIKEFFVKSKQEKKVILGIGASTKGNVILQYCNLDQHDLRFIGDVNQDKFNSYTPGSNIKIISEEEMLKLDYDYLMILPWHFKDFFIQNKIFKGKKLFFPLPKLEIIEVR